MSSTMNAEALTMTGNKKTEKSSNQDTDSKGGRPTKESQGESVSEKTIQNKESQN